MLTCSGASGMTYFGVDSHEPICRPVIFSAYNVPCVLKVCGSAHVQVLHLQLMPVSVGRDNREWLTVLGNICAYIFSSRSII